MANIQITGANEGNLKNLTFEIPKNKLVVFTGLSGSGKSTLLLDILFNECQRQYLEAMSLQGIQKPKVERIRGASPAVLIAQTDTNRTPRSTVGTMTDVYTDLRMVYEKLGTRTCPYCKEVISAADCREETEKVNQDFHVYMYCCKCGRRMDKITRTWFSFNTQEGACPACEGLGRIHTVKREKAVNETLALEEGAVNCWEAQYGKYQITVLHRAFRHYGVPIPVNIPVQQFSEIQKAILYDGVESGRVVQAFPGSRPPKTAASGRFEGVLPMLLRRLADKNGAAGKLEAYFDSVECPACRGERLCELSRGITVKGTRLPHLSGYSLDRLYEWVCELRGSLSGPQLELVKAYLLDIETKLKRFLRVGLGYLTPDRQIITLSGGELQRLRLAAAGTIEDIKGREASVTGRYLRRPQPAKTVFRKAKGAVHIENAEKFNLQHISADIPTGCIVTVTGPSGSGKSTLIFEVLAKGSLDGECSRVSGLEQFDRIVEIGQSPINRMKRSNVATYSGVYAEIRTIFAKLDAAREAGLTAKHFSFNSPDVLSVKYKGLSVEDVLNLSAEEAAEVFSGRTKINMLLELLKEAGLGYLQLGQSLTTLSGGEGQRLKLARELAGNRGGQGSLYLMDEPTTGLHPKDIEHFLILLNRLADAGNSVVVAEHNRQLIRNSDWILELGPEGGEKGGCLMFTGTPGELKLSDKSITAKYL